MSDEVAKQFEEEDQQKAEVSGNAGRSFSITVTMHPNGLVELSGPIANKVLANGLLGAGIQELHRWHLMQEQKSLAKPHGQGINGLLKKMGRG